jgi:hypothetical protein
MADWTTEQLSALFDLPNQFFLQDSNKDMIALNEYMSDSVAITPEAVTLKDGWITWWNGLTWGQKNIDSATWDEARNRRNAFFLANAPTKKDKADVQNFLNTAVTEEETEGKPRRVLSSGMLPSPPPPPPKPLIPSWFKIGAGVAVLGGLAAGIATIVSRFNPVGIVAGIVKKKG